MNPNGNTLWIQALPAFLDKQSSLVKAGIAVAIILLLGSFGPTRKVAYILGWVLLLDGLLVGLKGSI